MRVAVDVADAEGADIWLHDLARGTETRLTTDPATDDAPLWTPDGERVVFGSNRDGQIALFWMLADTPGDAERLVTGEFGGSTTVEADSWSPDGQQLLVFAAAPPDISLIAMDGERRREPFIATEFDEGAPAISPDGGWVAYHSTESGQPEVYVQRFPALGGKSTISTDGGAQPVWSPDGRELFYRGPRGMMAVPVETGATFRAGEPNVLFDQQYCRFLSRRTYDLAPDGRFLMVKATADDQTGPTAQVVLVRNWLEELKRLVPVD